MTFWKRNELKGGVCGYAAKIRSSHRLSSGRGRKGVVKTPQSYRESISNYLDESSLMDLWRPFVLSPLKRAGTNNGEKGSTDTPVLSLSPTQSCGNNKRLAGIFWSFARFPWSLYREQKEGRAKWDETLTSIIPTSFKAFVYTFRCNCCRHSYFPGPPLSATWQINRACRWKCGSIG